MDTVAIIDAELLIYRFAFRYNDKNKLKQACNDVDAEIKRIQASTFSSDNIICLSDKLNFRHDILPNYKDSRGTKPVLHNDIRKHVEDNYNIKRVSTLEADDLIGIFGTWDERYIMCSIDKDLNQIPGKHYNWKENKLYCVSLEEGDYYHLYQVLVGDKADNYFGCPGIGPVKATRILKESFDACSCDMSYAEKIKQVWNDIVKVYEHGGLNEEYAYKQARVSRICRKEDYDFEAKAVKLWTV